MGTKLRITATLEPRGPAGAIVLSDEQVAKLGEGKKAFPVTVTVKGTPMTLRLARMSGENLIGFSKAARAEAGVEIGGSYRVVIQADARRAHRRGPGRRGEGAEGREGRRRVRRAGLLAPQGVRAVDRGGEEARDPGRPHREDGHDGGRGKDPLTRLVPGPAAV